MRRIRMKIMDFWLKNILFIMYILVNIFLLFTVSPFLLIVFLCVSVPLWQNFIISLT